mmetsp:Transcript_37032/g.101912  ORF Transcript_37032/g.101912 Transcript_37032/m.101912 type:complete len:294 (+) Transcript_37032:673-1554(+)
MASAKRRGPRGGHGFPDLLQALPLAAGVDVAATHRPLTHLSAACRTRPAVAERLALVPPDRAGLKARLHLPDDDAPQGKRLRPRERAGESLRVQASLVQCLASVDVADASQAALVHQNCADGLLLRALAGSQEPLGVGVFAQRVWPQLGEQALVQLRGRAMFDGHGGQVGNDARLTRASFRLRLQSQAGVRCDVRFLLLIRGEGARHAEVDVHDQSRSTAQPAEEIKHVLAVHLDAQERTTCFVDRLCPSPEAAVGRGRHEDPAHEGPPMLRRHAVTAVAFDHGGGDRRPRST